MMKLMVRPRTGFAITESLLILITLGIIGFVGWFVWNSNDTYDNRLDDVGSIAFDAQAKKLVAVGDIVCDPHDPHLLIKNLGYCQDSNTYKLTAKINPNAILALGDLQYDDGALDKFISRYDKTWGKLKSITYPAPGNHEYGTNAASGYFGYFNNTKANGPAGETGKGYYSFDLGGWHFISLNSNCAFVGGCGEGSPQLEWLKADLQKNKLSCTAAFWHHPHFTSGNYADDEAAQNLSTNFWTVLAGNKADVILNGHDHIYERFSLLSPSGDKSENGIRQFTVGTGGKALYKKKAAITGSEIAIDDKFGVLVMELYQKAYRWQFISLDGKVLDSGYQQCVV